MEHTSGGGHCANKGTKCAFDARSVREAIREDEQKRLHRCRARLRKRCSDQECVLCRSRRSEPGLDPPQALHRVRERCGDATHGGGEPDSRSLLLERGLTLPKGRSHLDEQLPRILEDAELNPVRLIPCSAGSASGWNWSNWQGIEFEEMDRVIQKNSQRE